MPTNTLSPHTILRGTAYTYEILKVLGQGSFGITYLASVRVQGALGHLDANIKVAIKEFFMRDVNGRREGSVTCEGDTTLFNNYRRDFVREAVNLSKLNHPNIIRVLENFDSNGTSYYAMEFVEGTNLNEYIIQNGGLSEYESLDIMSSIAEAVNYMHQNRMLHLDIKPLNIMRGVDGRLSLIDFGLSKQFDSNGEPESSTHIGGGTMGYAPLEQSCYQRGDGFPATMDVYALGATLYKCITSQTPPDASSVLNKGLPLDEMRSRGLTEATIRLIEKSMAPVVQDRIHTADEFCKSLESARYGARKEKKNDSSGFNEVFWTEPDEAPDNNPFNKRHEIYHFEFVSELVKQMLEEFISRMKQTSEGKLVSYVPVDYQFYNEIMGEPELDSTGGFFGSRRMTLAETLRLIDRLQDITGCHWRLPDELELNESFSSSSPTLRPDECYLSYNLSTFEFSLLGAGSAHFKPEELIDESHPLRFLVKLVQDPDFGLLKKVGRIDEQKQFPVGVYEYCALNEYTTPAFFDEIGHWHFGVCPVGLKGGGWGLLSSKGEFLTKIGAYRFMDDAEVMNIHVSRIPCERFDVGVRCYTREGDISIVEMCRPGQVCDVVHLPENKGVVLQRNDYSQILEWESGELETAAFVYEEGTIQWTAVSSGLYFDGQNNGHRWVDLGLSVRWACCNLGSDVPEADGEYFAWSEICPKNRYIWDNLKYHVSGGVLKRHRFSKYVDDGKFGVIDQRNKLEECDDAARAVLGGRWRMPTQSDFEELIEKCTWTWMSLDGHNGYKVTSKINGNSIFLPAAGICNDSDICLVGDLGYYWSSSLIEGSGFMACYLSLISSSTGFGRGRCEGMSVRPVCP